MTMTDCVKIIEIAHIEEALPLLKPCHIGQNKTGYRRFYKEKCQSVIR